MSYKYFPAFTHQKYKKPSDIQDGKKNEVRMNSYIAYKTILRLVQENGDVYDLPMARQYRVEDFSTESHLKALEWFLDVCWNTINLHIFQEGDKFFHGQRTNLKMFNKDRKEIDVDEKQRLINLR